MKQLMLDVEALDVESFQIDGSGGPGGADAMGISRFCTQTCP